MVSASMDQPASSRSSPSAGRKGSLTPARSAMPRARGVSQPSTPSRRSDRLLGVDGWLTPRARGMADRAGVSDPFRPAEGLLRELAGWSIDAETIRRYCHEAAAAARQRRGARAALPRQFAGAKGDREMHIDAGKVN